MSELEVAREQEVSWREAMGAPGEPTLLTSWFIVPQLFVFVLYCGVEQGWPLLHAHNVNCALVYSAFVSAVWVMAYGWEIRDRRRRIIAMREAGGLQLFAPIARIDPVKITWTLLLAAMAVLVMSSPRAFGMSALCVLACLCMTALLRWAIERRRAVREQRALWTALAAQMEREGAHRLEGDPQRVAVAQRFWREQQEHAALMLQRRFEPVLSPAAAPVSRRPHHLMFGVLCLIGAMLLFGELLVLAIFCAALIIPFAAAGVWVVESVLKMQRRHAKRRIFALESHRITTMAELAGGLTLAEHESDEALSGALSPDGAQGGELSGVEL
jgi:hypothetical protein